MDKRSILLKIVKKNDRHILTLKRAKNGVEYLSFDALEKYNNIVQGFSTKIGGVSTGPYATMNLSFSREPDNREGVLENYKRMAQQVTKSIKQLAMEHAEFFIELHSDYNKISANGADNAIFTLQSNLGQSAQPLAKICFIVLFFIWWYNLYQFNKEWG